MKNETKLHNAKPFVYEFERTRDWPDKVRLKMIEKSQFYFSDEKVYQYGFYDGYQLQQKKIVEAIQLIQDARSNNGSDSLLQDAIILLLSSGLK